MKYEALSAELDEVHTRRDLFTKRLSAVSIMACDEEGQALPEHPEIKGLDNEL